MSDCIICSGDRSIRLPVRRRVSATFDADIKCSPIGESYRTYPCPECEAEQPGEEKVHFVYAEESIRTYGEPLPEAAKKSVIEHLAHLSARVILEDGLIEVREEVRGDEIMFRSRVGVVHKRVVERIEERAFSKMKEFLGNVSGKAAEAISVWGSAYTGSEGSIEKGQAMRFVRQAFNQHLSETEQKIFSSRHGG